MLAKSRSASVAGRTRMLEKNSSGTRSGYITGLTPDGTLWSLR